MEHLGLCFSFHQFSSGPTHIRRIRYLHGHHREQGGGKTNPYRRPKHHSLPANGSSVVGN